VCCVWKQLNVRHALRDAFLKIAVISFAINALIKISINLDQKIQTVDFISVIVVLQMQIAF
jgi:hypothetical protein